MLLSRSGPRMSAAMDGTVVSGTADAVGTCGDGGGGGGTESDRGVDGLGGLWMCKLDFSVMGCA